MPSLVRGVTGQCFITGVIGEVEGCLLVRCQLTGTWQIFVLFLLQVPPHSVLGGAGWGTLFSHLWNILKCWGWRWLQSTSGGNGGWLWREAERKTRGKGQKPRDLAWLCCSWFGWFLAFSGPYIFLICKNRHKSVVLNLFRTVGLFYFFCVSESSGFVPKKNV